MYRPTPLPTLLQQQRFRVCLNLLRPHKPQRPLPVNEDTIRPGGEDCFAKAGPPLRRFDRKRTVPAVATF